MRPEETIEEAIKATIQLYAALCSSIQLGGPIAMLSI